MSSYKTHLYLIKSLTNIHPGSGDNDYGTVDKVIQRDTADNLPTIHSTSLKGALRAFFESTPEFFEGQNDEKDKAIKYIFGEKPNAPSENKVESRGHYKFFSGNLLSLPVRSTHVPYFNVTGTNIIQHLNEMCNDFGCKSDGLDEIRTLLDIETSFPFVFADGKNILLEGQETFSVENTSSDLKNCSELLGKNIGVADPSQMKAFAEELPIIARNRLENGESKNLWYEEVLPRDTRFYFLLRVPESDNYIEEFEKCLAKNIVQIGANASVGYGYCKISKF